MSEPERKNRVGQRVQFCYQPLMIGEITGWNERDGGWDATVVVPDLGTPMLFPEGFVAYLDEHPPVQP